MIEFIIAEGDTTEPTLPDGVGFAIWHNNFPKGFEDWPGGVFEFDGIPSMPDLFKTRKELKERAQQGEENAEVLYKLDELALAGIINYDEAESFTDKTASGKQAIRKAVQKLYPEMTLSFVGETIRINTIPTAITVKSMQKSYEGLAGLMNHEQAVETIADIMYEKLEPLFGRAENERDAESYSEFEDF